MSINFSVRRLDRDTYVRVAGCDDLNVSHGNAADILANLSLPFDQTVFSLEQFEAECATFLRIAAGTEVDAKRPARRSGQWVECNRTSGYISDKIQSLSALASRGLALGATHMTAG